MPPSDAHDSFSQPSLWQRQLGDLAAQALHHVPPARMTELAHRLIVGGEPVPQAVETLSMVRLFCADLALFTAPPGRTSAVERLVRTLRLSPGSDEGRALAGLAKARFALFALTGCAAGGATPARDLMSGQPLRIDDAQLATLPAPAGLRFAARLAPVGDLAVVAGATIPLDDAMLEAVRPWQSRDGRSWTNPIRAAEAFYRHALRRGGLPFPELEAEPEVEPDVFPHRAEDGPLHALAFAWSKLAEGVAAPADQERQARALSIDGDTLIDALAAATLARSFRHFDLAAGYERVLALMLDTLERRAAIGQRGSTRVLAWVEQQLANSAVPPEARALFQRLRSRAASAEDAGLDRLRGRIRALRAKTVEQGCTEEEALAAAEKVADLLERYGLSLSELELRHQPCDGFGIDTGRKRATPLDHIVPTIAEFCDCRCWLELTPDKMIRHVFFGLPADTAGARYLYDVIAAAVAAQTAAFKAGDLYDEHHSSQRASATRSFQVGMVHGIAEKLHAIKLQRAAGLRSTHGRDLVPLKRGVIEDELDKLGIAFKAKAKRASRVLGDAYHAGREAGAEFELHHGVEGPSTP
jgi:hypothetical protein